MMPHPSSVVAQQLAGVSRRVFLRRVAAGLGGLALAACTAPPTASLPTPIASEVARPTATLSSATVLAEPPPSAAPATPAQSDTLRRFPTGFRWGVATSAYQVEGAAQADGRGESIWDRFSHTPGRTHGGDTGDVAADHYYRYAQDFDLMRELGFQTYRFSVAWPRVLPDGRTLNQAGVDFYARLVEAMLERDIQPMATLFHWDLPQALQELGGWEHRDTAARFAEYADVLFRALGDRVPDWLTLNEPKTVAYVGYLYGSHAPGFRDRTRAYAALHTMLLGHGLAVQAFRAAGLPSGRRVGIALNLSPVYAAPGVPADQAAVQRQDGFENRLFLDPVLRGGYPADLQEELTRVAPAGTYQPGDAAIIGAPIDLLGVNYYNPTYVRPGGEVVPGPGLHSQASWQEIYPDGLYDLLVRIKHDYGDLPLSITENGAPFPDVVGPDGSIDDPQRLQVLQDHFVAAHRAVAAGVNLESYHVWSFLDNFEWAEGYSQRWGIVYVDFATQQRTPKRSALWYRDVIRANGL